MEAVQDLQSEFANNINTQSFNVCLGTYHYCPAHLPTTVGRLDRITTAEGKQTGWRHIITKTRAH
jgi:hypothetical protein